MEDLVDQLSKTFCLPHDSDILMSRVSDCSSIPEHSEDLQIHGTVFMASVLPSIMSFLISYTVNSYILSTDIQ